MDKDQLSELLLQSLTHEEGCVLVYRAALGCVSNRDLHAEWSESLRETEQHVLILTLVCDSLGIDPGRRTECCRMTAQLTEALERTLLAASKMADREEAQRVACDCLVLAETRHHASWTLIAQCADSHRGPEARVLKSAVEHVESEVHGKLSRARNWCRELWLDALWSTPAATDAPVDTTVASGEAALDDDAREEILHLEERLSLEATLGEWASADASGVRPSRGRAA